MLIATHYQMTRTRLVHLLEEIQTVSRWTVSLCVEPRTSEAAVQGLLQSIVDIKQIPSDIPRLMANSSTGAVLLWGPDHRYLVYPPFPVPSARGIVTGAIEPLHSLLHTDFRLALVLVRLGTYGIGVFQGDCLVSSKVGTGLVHGRHRQGGSSAHRFERHREKQMESFFTRVCLHAREQLGPYLKRLDYLIYGGTRETTTEFRRQCHFLQEFDAITVDRLLNVRDPKQSGLLEGFREAWSSRVIQWDET